MGRTFTFLVVACLVIAGSVFARSTVECRTAKPQPMLRPHGPVAAVQIGAATTPRPSGQKKNSPNPRIYPIAPGVWYPGDGPIPENPVRYYRVRCWPGCHHGSPYGKYPKTPQG